MRQVVLGLLAGVVLAQGGPALIAGATRGSDSVKHACLDGHSTEAALSALRGFETVAGGTSQPACGASRDMLGVPTGVQRTNYNRGSLGGTRKTCSAFDGCRGGSGCEDKPVSVELAGYGADVYGWHGPNASAALGDDACAEAAHKEACIMNVCTCATSEFGDTNVRCKEFSLEGDSAHAWDALLAGLFEDARWASAFNSPALASAMSSMLVLLVVACGAFWLAVGSGRRVGAGATARLSCRASSGISHRTVAATHKPSANAVFWSKFARPTDPTTAPNGVTTNAPALKLVIEHVPALEPVTAGGAPLPSIKEFSEEPGPAGDADWTVSTKEFPEETAAPAGLDEWKPPSPLCKIERKGESNLIDRSKKPTKSLTPIGRVDPNGFAALLGTEVDEKDLAGVGSGSVGDAPPSSTTPSGAVEETPPTSTRSGFRFGQVCSTKLLCHKGRAMFFLLWLLPVTTAQVDYASPIQLGFLYAQSPASWLVESRSQFKLALDDVNAAGMLPYNISYVTANTREQEFFALRGCIDLLDDSSVIGIVGTGYSAALSAAAAYASARQKPIVSPGATRVTFTDKTKFPYLVRSVGSDATELGGMVFAIESLGWRSVVVVYSVDFITAASYFRSAAQARGIDVVIEARVSSSGETWKTFAALEAVRHSGARILVSITSSADQEELHQAAADIGLHNEGYVWLGWSASFTSTIPLPGYIFVQAAAAQPSAAAAASFLSHFQKGTLTYDEAIHGSYNATSGAPFYDAAHEGVRWDTDYAPVGDGLPDHWGKYVYDTAWLYAHALKRLAEAGTSPHDGEALLAALLATSFEGVTGRLEISPADQDRVQGFQLHSLVPENLNASAARNSSAVSTAPLVDVVAANISYLWWPLGYVPSDGSSADAASCSLEWPLGQEVFVGQSATLSVSLNNAFRRPVTAADATVNITIVGDQSCARVMPLPTATAPVGSSASSIRAFTVELREVGTCAIRVHVKHGAPPPAFIGAIELSVSQETLPDILFGLTLTLVLLALAALALFLVARRFNLAKRRRQLLWRSTRQPPRLRSKAGGEYHLFLSHTWSSGQDQVHMIKRRLATLAPKMKVFLDVDDLEEFGTLADNVAASDVVLLFLSRGYFASKACKIEYMAACRLGKPIVVVHESNENHGGAPLEELRNQCPDECRAHLFGSRAVVLWLRSEVFQLVTLKKIVAVVLSADGGEGATGKQAGGGDEMASVASDPSTRSRESRVGGSSSGRLERATMASAEAARRVAARAMARTPAKKECESADLHLHKELKPAAGLGPGPGLALLYSRHNPGARLVASQLAATVAGCVAVEAPAGGATSVGGGRVLPLLVLNARTFEGADGEALAREVCGWRAAFKETVCAAERTRQRLEAASGLAKLTNRLEALTGVDVDGDGDVNEKCLERGSLSLASNVQSGQVSLGEASGRAQPKHGGAVGEASERVRSSSSASEADSEPEEPAGGVEMGRLLLVHMLDPEDDGCRFEQVMAQTPQHLVDDKLYSQIALPWFHAPDYRVAALAVLSHTLVKEGSSAPSSRARGGTRWWPRTRSGPVTERRASGRLMFRRRSSAPV